jgi:hypothetical protein
MPRERTAATKTPAPSAGIRDEDRDAEMEVDDVTKVAAACFVDDTLNFTWGGAQVD